jgi:class 3 adenylate cyclase
MANFSAGLCRNQAGYLLIGNLIIISILSIMMLYHLMLFLTTRERAYLYYALYVLAVDLVIISDGIFLPFVQMPGGHFVWSQLTYIFFGLISVFYYLFSRAFLHTREILPKWDRAMVFLILFKMLVLVLGEVMRLWLEDPWFTDQARYLIFGLDIPFLLVFFIPLYRSGIRSGRYFMVATAIIFLFGFAVVLFGRMLGINPFVPFVLAFILHILVFSLGLGDRLRREQEEKLAAQEALNRELKKINEATSRFVPYQFLRSLGKESVLDVQLGDGVQKEMSVFFADIRSYTTLSEKMSPRENFEFLNQYLGQVGPIIQTHGGFVNQYYGDGIMALFQEPPLDALMAAIQIQRSLQQFNLQREQTGKEPIRIGIGMHTGPLLMGVIGDQNRMDAGVVSDTVNTAARMEGLTKHFGASILLSEKTMAPIPPDRRPPHRYLGKVQVKGRRTVLSIYECFAGEKDKQRQLKGETLVLFEEALQAYEQRKFQQASQTWETILRKNPLDVAAHRYFRMSKQYQDQPPPADWQAIQNMQAK